MPLTADDFTLFYGKDREARRLDLLNAFSQELHDLADACDPATFGVDQKDVYDEAYRKAGKLDAQHFALNFSPERTGLIDVLRNELLVEGRTATTHEGGALGLRERQDDGTRECTFDPAALLEQSCGPAIAHVAFYSDIDHEVMPIRSGYRVTITYNLTLRTTPVTFKGTYAPGAAQRLDVPPRGGNLLFCLRHQYPLPTSYKDSCHAQEALQGLASYLKSSDALVLDVVQSLALDVSLKIVYQQPTQYGGTIYIMCDRAAPLDEHDKIENLYMHLAECANSQLLSGSTEGFWKDDSVVDVHWIYATPGGVNSTKTSFMAYGNEATLAHTYWKVSVFVCIGIAGNRATALVS
ncbi:hypothetical protein C8Q79DRAFT_1012894 [Trametes meyenii]|nr:hypothetical protein C8Q79DRAFT_1012894 [Trametes meyenii]